MGIVWAMIGASFITAGVILGIQTYLQLRSERGGEKRGQK